jgi:hypothetical protein
MYASSNPRHGIKDATCTVAEFESRSLGRLLYQPDCSSPEYETAGLAGLVVADTSARWRAMLAGCEKPSGNARNVFE